MYLLKQICRFVVPGILVLACTNPVITDKDKPVDSGFERYDSLRTDLQSIFDSVSVKGAVLIFDPQKNICISNDFERSRQGFLPASTFKIPNSIIALETGVVSNDSTLFYWNGEKRRLPSWEKDLTFREAFHASCVPCYQEVARKIGVARMRHFLDEFQYGEMKVDSFSIDKFWLEGTSTISQQQQIDFLYKFYQRRLTLQKNTYNIMSRMLVIDDNDQYKISGKTGWAIRERNNTGWFVGYIEKENEVYFFATIVEPNTTFNMDFFPVIRSEITLKALKQLNIIQ